jgi:hypothetical protein
MVLKIKVYLLLVTSDRLLRPILKGEKRRSPDDL